MLRALPGALLPPQRGFGNPPAELCLSHRWARSGGNVSSPVEAVADDYLMVLARVVVEPERFEGKRDRRAQATPLERVPAALRCAGDAGARLGSQSLPLGPCRLKPPARSRSRCSRWESVAASGEGWAGSRFHSIRCVIPHDDRGAGSGIPIPHPPLLRGCLPWSWSGREVPDLVSVATQGGDERGFLHGGCSGGAG